MASDQNIVITGANGYIGKEFIKKLSGTGRRIYAVTSSDAQNRGWMEKLPDVDIVCAGAEEYDQLDRKIPACDVLFHFAWKETRGSARDDAGLQAQNATYAMELAKAMYRIGCRRIVQIGSMAEYGRQEQIVTETSICNPVTEYAKAKLKCYSEMKAYCETQGIHFIELRLGSVYGANMPDNNLLTKIVKCLEKGEPCSLATSCEQKWEYINIRNVVEILMQLTDNPHEEGIYNITSSDTRRLKDFIGVIESRMNRHGLITYGELTEGLGCQSIFSDNSKMRSCFDCGAMIVFEDGIGQLIDTDYETILGICIPTYNRAEILKENLLNIIKHIGAYKIPIYISDNCSTDHTTEVINEVREIYPYISYSKNESNLGVDRNFEKVLKMCGETYAWLLGDDDTIDTDIKPMLELLESEKPDILVLGVDDNIKEGVYSDRLWILNELTLQMTWMSGEIIANRLLKKFDFERYYDTQFVHMGTILDYIGRFGEIRLLYIHNQYARCMRPKYIEYTHRVLEIYAKGWTELLMKLPGYSLEEKKAQCRIRTKRTGMLNNRVLLSMRSQGYLDPGSLKEYRNYIKLYNGSPYFLLFLISIFPRGIGLFMRKLYKRCLMRR